MSGTDAASLNNKKQQVSVVVPHQNNCENGLIRGGAGSQSEPSDWFGAGVAAPLTHQILQPGIAAKTAGLHLVDGTGAHHETNDASKL